MRVSQRRRNLAHDLCGLVETQVPLALEPLAQAFALDVRHDVVQQAAGFAGVVQRQDVGVRKARGDLDFLQEALGPDGAGQLGIEHLHGDSASVLTIAGEVDGGHAATPELALDLIPLANRSLEPVQ